MKYCFLLLLALLSTACSSTKETAKQAEPLYQPNWQSLKAHRDPEWFRDAKFGIYTHWSPITVATETAPSAMEWYGQQLYLPKHAAFNYHKERFGVASKMLNCLSGGARVTQRVAQRSKATRRSQIS